MVTTDQRTDQQLIAAANLGDARAFETLYYRYRDWVTALAYRLTGNREDALDVLQETFAYFFGKFPGFSLTARLKTFLYPVVKHGSLARLRRRGRVAQLGDADEALAAAPPAEARPAASGLSALLASLSEAEREIILLRFVDDLPLKEIAHLLEIPLGTVKSRLHNTLKRLRRDPRTKKHFEP